MIRLLKELVATGALMASLGVLPAAAADFTFQFVNDSGKALALKLFSRAESRRQWPSRTKSYSLQSDSSVQELKIDCDEGEQICWGAWTGASGPGTAGGSHRREGGPSKMLVGAGDRGTESCTDCCHVCKDGGRAPVAKLGDNLIAR